MTAVLFGSISTLADTSELQRASFNEAFAEHGLDWTWDREEYRGLLTSNGGAQRIADQAEEKGVEVDAEAVHATKSERFQAKLREGGVQPRPGVVEVIEAARGRGVRTALVTTTSAANVEALLGALSGALGEDAFDLVVDSTQVDTPKPDPAAYRYALEQLGEEGDACVAIEDNVGGVAAASAAGVTAFALPNSNTAGHDFAQADRVLDQLDADTVLGAAGADGAA